MKIKFDNQLIEVEHDLSVLELLNLFGYSSAKIAVAVNQTFIPNKEYATVIVKSHDTIDIIFPMQGG